MATRAGERLFCDTNVLLSAVDRRRPLHSRAFRVLNEVPNQGVELCVSGQVLRECLVVSTRPVEANGLGLTLAAAVGNNRAFAERVTVLEETRGVASRLPPSRGGSRVQRQGDPRREHRRHHAGTRGHAGGHRESAGSDAVRRRRGHPAVRGVRNGITPAPGREAFGRVRD